MLERMTVQRRLVKAVAGLAACAAVIAAVWIGVGGSDAQRVFAAAIDRVTQARTFYCRTTSEFVKQDGQKEVWETVYMFKEPDLERIEYKAGLPHPGEVHITDYGKRRHLSLHPDDKSAALEDISSAFAVDDRTGNLHLTRLSTGERDQLLSLSAMAVGSLEDTELDGQSVRVLQARQPKRIITAWIRPETGLPVQLAIELPEQQRRVLWTSIRIDEELDDALFSVEPPAGYTLFKGGLYKPGPEDTMKLMAKMMHLLRACHVYRERNNDQFPRELGELTNLKAVGISAEALKTILAAPDQPDGPPVILYRQPREGREWGKEIALYQAFDEWPANGLIAVGFADGHCGVISRERFEELMR
jgi:outer membrane lipoprotein-sorting protein